MAKVSSLTAIDASEQAIRQLLVGKETIGDDVSRIEIYCSDDLTKLRARHHKLVQAVDVANSREQSISLETRRALTMLNGASWMFSDPITENSAMLDIERQARGEDLERLLRKREDSLALPLRELFHGVYGDKLRHLSFDIGYSPRLNIRAELTKGAIEYSPAMESTVPAELSTLLSNVYGRNVKASICAYRERRVFANFSNLGQSERNVLAEVELGNRGSYLRRSAVKFLCAKILPEQSLTMLDEFSFELRVP